MSVFQLNHCMCMSCYVNLILTGETFSHGLLFKVPKGIYEMQCTVLYICMYDMLNSLILLQ